jgi:hypothetical protein
MKQLLYSFLIFLVACTTAPKKNKEVADLKKQKYSIDSAINVGNLLLFVKVKGKPGLIPLVRGMDQKKMEAAYNVFKDKSGKVIYISEMPFSPDNEYFISYKNYFGPNGKLIAFERLNNFFGSECAERAAMEDLIKFYNKDFKVVDSIYTLTDTRKNKLNKVKCKFPYNFPYTISNTLEEYKKKRGIEGL